MSRKDKHLNEREDIEMRCIECNSNKTKFSGADDTWSVECQKCGCTYSGNAYDDTVTITKHGDSIIRKFRITIAKGMKR